MLAEGGNALEAMVAMAAMIAVVYPHMNSIGGDGFWLIVEPGKAPLAIDACGRAAGLATVATSVYLLLTSPKRSDVALPAPAPPRLAISGKGSTIVLQGHF